MENDEPEDWTLQDHLSHGRTAIGEIANAPAASICEPRVCFHLSPLTPADDKKWGMEAAYCQLAKREFDRSAQDFDVDYIGGLCGIEVWQEIIPDEAWLTQTVPLIWEIATKSEMFFGGWSFEPRSGLFLSVSPTLNVYDGSNLRGLPPSGVTGSFERLSGWLKSKLG